MSETHEFRDVLYQEGDLIAASYGRHSGVVLFGEFAMHEGFPCMWVTREEFCDFLRGMKTDDLYSYVRLWEFIGIVKGDGNEYLCEKCNKYDSSVSYEAKGVCDECSTNKNTRE